MQERFDANMCGSMCLLSDDRSMVSKTKANYDIALLSKIVSTGMHCWKFKIIKVHPSGYTFIIGVWNTKYSIDVNHTMFTEATENKMYGWNGSNALASIGTEYSQHSYGKKHKDGDIVEMILDLHKWELRYTLNGKDYGACWSNIDQSTYKAMVHMYKDGDSVQILSYSST